MILVELIGEEVEFYVFNEDDWKKTAEKQNEWKEFVGAIKQNGEKVDIVMNSNELLGYIDNKTNLIEVPDVLYVVDALKQKIFKYE